MGNEYHELNLKELILTVLKKWPLLCFLLLLCSGSTYYISTNYLQPVYRASATLFIGKEHNSLGGIGISFTELQINTQLMYDYKQIAQTRHVIEKVIDELHLNMSVNMFKNSIGIDTIKDSRLFVVSFISTNRELARDAANELANQLSIAVSEIVKVENIQIIDAALLPEGPISPNIYKNTLVAGILGIMAGVFFIFLLELFNNTFKKESDVEKELGIPVIGIIPKLKGEKR